MSKYTGEFKSINNVDYKIEIQSSTGSKNEKLLLSGTPFVTNQKSSDNLYEPMKPTGATVSILTGGLPDIYSGSALGTKVHVTSGDKVVWTGYLSPCAYTQGFDTELEELELECVDGLSVLKDIPYASSSKDISDFLNIVFKCLKKSNCYKTLYVCDVVQRVSIWNNTSPLEEMKISEGNFFEDKDYENQPDNDVAWSCYDVLEQISQYLGYTMTAQGDEVYMIDYDAMVHTDNVYKGTYIKYDISGSAPVSKGLVTLSNSYTIKSNSYAENGSTITLSEIFNKLTVKDSFYEIPDQFEAVGNKKNLQNITSEYDIWEDWQKDDSKHFKECALFTETNKNGEKESFFVMIYQLDGEGKYFVIGKFFKNSALTTYHYTSASNNSVAPETNFDPYKYSYLFPYKGACQVGYFVQKLDDDHYNAWKNTLGTWKVKSRDDKLKAFQKLVNIANIQNKDLTNYILCLNQSTNHIDHDKTTNYKYFTIKKDVSVAHGGEGSYIIIKGELTRHDKENSPWPHQGNISFDKGQRKTSIYAGENYFYAQLKFGDYYWGCDNYNNQGRWGTVPTYFKIYYGDPVKEMRVDVWLDKTLQFYNTSPLWGVDDTGVVIPLPEKENLTGTIEFTVFANKDTKGVYDRNNHSPKKNSYSGFPPRVVLFKDLSLELGYSDDALNDEAASSDTYYTNECEYPNVNEADEIEFKICTNDEKKANYSSVTYSGIGEANQYIDKMYRKDNQLLMRMEEHYIYKFVTQYSEPKVKYEVNLKESIGLLPYTVITSALFPGKKFVINSKTTDYRFNKTELTLEQK